MNLQYRDNSRVKLVIRMHGTITYTQKPRRHFVVILSLSSSHSS